MPLVSACEASQQASFEDRVRGLVLTNYVHGFPAEEFLELGGSPFPMLEPMLADSALKDYWPNIVLAIGYSTSRLAFPLLRSFLWDRFRGEVDFATLRALGSVPTAMGCLTTPDSSEVLAFLERGTDPKTWGGLPWWSPRFETRDDLCFYFSKLSVSGLGYSEYATAGAILRRLESGPPDPRLSFVVKSARERNEEILRNTRLGYLRAHREEGKH